MFVNVCAKYITKEPTECHSAGNIVIQSTWDANSHID